MLPQKLFRFVKEEVNLFKIPINSLEVKVMKMRLEDIYQLYEMMLEKVEEIDPKELETVDAGVDEEIPKEETFSFPEVEPYPVVERLEEGDVIEIAPSDDGLPYLLLVGEINPKAGEATLFPLSQFIELGTPWDEIVHIEGKPYIAQTDIFITAPTEVEFSRLFKEKTPLRIGKVQKEELQKVKEVYRRERGGVGGMAGGVKKLFKEREAERYSKLQMQILKGMELLDRENKTRKRRKR